MWFNGSELSTKAQRALRHEKVTIVARCTGNIHQVYEEATIDPQELKRYSEQLSWFLCARIDESVAINFLRAHAQYQRCFQLAFRRHRRELYVPLELAFHYEDGSTYRLDDHARPKVLEQIDETECFTIPMGDRILLHEFERFFHKKCFRPADKDRVAELIQQSGCSHPDAHKILDALLEFRLIKPRLPAAESKRFIQVPGIRLAPTMGREEIIATLEKARRECTVADLAFYAYRDLSRCDWLPFLKAALERNPVIIEAVKGVEDSQFIDLLRNLAAESIYDGPRLAQPDEVWNFGRGDGVEKALAAANVLHHRHPEQEIHITVKPDEAVLEAGRIRSHFPSAKGLAAELAIRGSQMSVLPAGPRV